MTQLAAEHDAINLSQGFPGFEPPARLLDLIGEHLAAGRNQYAPLPGVPSLRAAIAAKVERLYGARVDADDEVTVCTGATEGLFATIQALVHRGDEVIVFDPAYDSYAPAVRLAGGKVIHLPLRETATRPDAHIDFDELADALSARTRLVIVNFPQNPLGSVLERADLDCLAEVLRDSPAFLMSDEVYEHIVFDGAQHHSLLTHAELRERSVVVSSFGKTYHATGWKVGYVVAPPALTTEFRRVHQFTCYAVVTPIQHALADFMQETPDHYAHLPAFYEEKRDRFCRALEDSRFRFRPAGGTFFQVLDYADISDEDDVDYARRLTREIGVASIPVSVFCRQPPGSRRLRFCFAKDDATLDRAAERLCRL